MYLVTLNPSIPAINGERITHIWCKEIAEKDTTVEMLGFGQGRSMAIPKYIAEDVPTVLAVNADPRLEAIKPENTHDVVGHLVV